MFSTIWIHHFPTGFPQHNKGWRGMAAISAAFTALGESSNSGLALGWVDMMSPTLNHQIQLWQKNMLHVNTTDKENVYIYMW